MEKNDDKVEPEQDKGKNDRDQDKAGSDGIDKQGGQADSATDGAGLEEGDVPDKLQDPRVLMGPRKRRPNTRYLGGQWAQ
ncbi:hypothetical protein OsI_30250 [Oryza sativa Indica Group]|uniref:Uncharacterized protein n=1 Tax=Oryza sativa subsp. indica TaxID=39946 RepID=B8B9N4_ORYSI|nr:hypothetical protein OsI_30250 [Oryza sativa Indica Group]